jgi:hypothetical protein
MQTARIHISEIFGEKGILARSLEHFEFRASQLQMAETIRDSLVEKVPAILEAGTGTGKTFGYLVPLMLSGKKCVISTGTKNLQEQIFFKDIPFISKATGIHGKIISAFTDSINSSRSPPFSTRLKQKPASASNNGSSERNSPTGPNYPGFRIMIPYGSMYPPLRISAWGPIVFTWKNVI